MASRAVFKVVDHDGDRREISVTGIAVTDGASYVTGNGLFSALITSLNAITLGAIEKTALVSNENNFSVALPGAANVQTNIQWLVRYTDDVLGSQRTMRIPTADLSLPTLVINGLTVADLSQAPWIDFHTNFEAFVRSEGNSVTLQSVEFYEG